MGSDFYSISRVHQITYRYIPNATLAWAEVLGATQDWAADPGATPGWASVPTSKAAAGWAAGASNSEAAVPTSKGYPYDAKAEGEAASGSTRGWVGGSRVGGRQSSPRWWGLRWRGRGQLG